MDRPQLAEPIGRVRRHLRQEIGGGGCRYRQDYLLRQHIAPVGKSQPVAAGRLGRNPGDRCVELDWVARLVRQCIDQRLHPVAEGEEGGRAIRRGVRGHARAAR